MFVCFFCLCFSSDRRCLQLNTSPIEGGYVAWTRQIKDSIGSLVETWAEFHRKAGCCKSTPSTTVWSKITNQLFHRTAFNINTIRTIIDNFNSKKRLSNLGQVIEEMDSLSLTCKAMRVNKIVGLTSPPPSRTRLKFLRRPVNPSGLHRTYPYSPEWHRECLPMHICTKMNSKKTSKWISVHCSTPYHTCNPHIWF